MYTMMKRLTSLLLAVCMLVAVLPAGMFSASAAVGDTYLYDFAADVLASAGDSTFSLLTSTTANAKFDTLQVQSTASTGAWRYVRGKSNPQLILHNGSGQTDYGIFIFESADTTTDFATFEINVPASGTYDLALKYYQHSSGRPFNFYLTPASNSTTYENYRGELRNQVNLTSFDNTSSHDATYTRTGVRLTAGKYYLTFQPNNTANDGNKRYVFLKSLTLTQKDATVPTSNRVSISRVDGQRNWVFTANTITPLVAKVLPRDMTLGFADQSVTWSIVSAKDTTGLAQNNYLSMNNADGKVTASLTLKGSNVVSAKLADGREEVFSVATGSLLYAFNNVAKEYLTEQYLAGKTAESVSFDNFMTYESTKNNWAYVGMDVPSSSPRPTAYQGSAGKTDRYGVFLDFSKENNKYIRFKIKVDKAGWYFPEVMYRDNGPASVRETQVYITPINMEPYENHIMTITPKSENASANAGLGVIASNRTSESRYFAAGEYYLTFYAGQNNGTNAQGVLAAHYLYLYHLALAEDTENFDKPVPKAVVIKKPQEAMSALTIGQSVTLGAQVLPKDADQKIVSWTSSNERVATVDSTGTVTAVGDGVALITATALDRRSETVAIQVGSGIQLYAFNEVAKKSLEVSPTGNLRLDISTTADFTSEGYLWKNFHNFGQGWRFVEKTSDSISNAYRGDSAQYDGDKDNTDPNYKYGLFLLSNDRNSYVRFEIEVTQDGNYTAEILQYLSINASATQGSRAVDLYISPIQLSVEDSMNDVYHVGTTELMKASRDTILTDYGLNSQHFTDKPIYLKAGKYNLILKGNGTIGRYIYLHAIALHRLEKDGETPVAPAPQMVQVSAPNNVDETFYMGANATVQFTATVHPLLADQRITWKSDNEDIATVDAAGLVTTKDVTIGTALITATTVNGIVGKIRVVIGQEAAPTYKYDFITPIRAIASGTFDSSTNWNLFTKTDLNFYGSYDGSVAGELSAPWMLLDTSVKDDPYCSYTISSHNDGYGLFVTHTIEEGATTSFKIKVAADGNYAAVLNISDWNLSNDYNVYLAPAKAKEWVHERWLVADYTITNHKNLYYGLELGELTLPAGEYILTFEVTGGHDFTNSGGLISVHNLCLYRSGEVFYTTEGAQVRTKGKQGLRFISTISKKEFNVDSADVVEFGTVLLPTQLLTKEAGVSDVNGDGVINGFDLTLDAPQAAKVRAYNRYIDNLDYVAFTAVLIGLEPAHYGMSVVARAYVKLANGDVIYGDTWTERCIYEVAKNGLAANPDMDADEKAALEKIVTDAINAGVAQ